MNPKHRKALTAAGAVVAAGVVAATLLQPSGTVTVRPGEDVAKAARGLKSGGVLTFAPGTYRGQITLSGLQGITLKCVDAVFTGGMVDLKLVDFRNVEVDGGTFIQAQLYGFMAQNGSGLTLRQVLSTKNGKTGILTASVDALTVVDCTSTDNQAEHGLYVSERCKTARISTSTFSGNGKAGCQINCDKGGGTDIQVDHLTCDGNQRIGGAAAIQLAYVNGGSVTDCTISNHRGRAGVALFWSTKRVTIDRNRFSFAPGFGKANVSIDKTSDGVIGQGNQAAAGVPLCVRE